MTRALITMCMALVACARTESAARDTATMIPGPSRGTTIGVPFAPNEVRVGARVGELVLDSIDVRRAIDSSWVGTARFRGELTLSGHLMRHPDSEVQAVCYEADSASASRMPRWAGDTRRAWFCFVDGAEAKGQLPATADAPATIVIDRFTIHRGLSDEVNAARLVRVVSPRPA
ncbi:MAG TPA: hypothetical protein VJ717_18260 [Gemmatimonadaceae bacterium]|nr:hypothetical protein [Gemmatimonadaceae bacterium]